MLLNSCKKYPEEIVDTYYWVYSFENTGKYVQSHSSLDIADEYKLEIPKRGKVKLSKNGEEIAALKREDFHYQITGADEILVDSIPFSSKRFTSYFVKADCDCSLFENSLGSYKGIYWSKNDFEQRDSSYEGILTIEKVESKYGCFISNNLSGVCYVNQNNVVTNFGFTDDRLDFYLDSVDFYFCSSCAYDRLMGQNSTLKISQGFNGAKVIR